VGGARAGRRRARGGFAVARGGAVFELAFGHFDPVGVDQAVERGGRRGDRARRFGFDGGRRRAGFEFSVEAFARAVAVGGRDAEVVGGVGAQAGERGGDGHRDAAFADGLGAGGDLAVAGRRAPF